MNSDDKIPDEDQVLLFLTSLSRSYKSLVQMMFVRRTTMEFDEVTTALQEKERIMINDQ